MLCEKQGEKSLSEIDAIEASRRGIETLLRITRPLDLYEITEQVGRPEAQVVADLDWLVTHGRIRATGSHPQKWTV